MKATRVADTLQKTGRSLAKCDFVVLTVTE